MEVVGDPAQYRAQSHIDQPAHPELGASPAHHVLVLEHAAAALHRRALDVLLSPFPAAPDRELVVRRGVGGLGSCRLDAARLVVAVLSAADCRHRIPPAHRTRHLETAEGSGYGIPARSPSQVPLAAAPAGANSL